MNNDKFTIKMKEALQGAENLASRYNNAEIGTEHMFLALLQQRFFNTTHNLLPRSPGTTRSHSSRR